MKEKIVVLLAIVMLTGSVHSVLYSSYFVNLVVGFTYFLGFMGLFSMWEAIRYPTKQKRWLVLIFGFMSMLIAYFTLEVLLADMYGRR